MRDDFKPKIKQALALRSGYRCAICNALTCGPSAESETSSINVGVAAHITAASSGGKRYDKTLTPAQRSSIENGIWLCQTHGKMIDDDVVRWTTKVLKECIKNHEHNLLAVIGVPAYSATNSLNEDNHSAGKDIKVREYAFTLVSSLAVPYKKILLSMLKDRKLSDDTELGILMCGSPSEKSEKLNKETRWTLFVNAEWLRWILSGQQLGYKFDYELPEQHIYGQIPEWPDTFFEFLQAMVETSTTFEWQRHSDGYLVLYQQT